jgi:choline kinase
MNAVILNAGEGKRLRPLTSLKPKCLLKLNNATILEHQLINLARCGIRDVVMVVGYHESQIVEEIKNKDFNLKIKFIKNPIYYKTNTVYSLWLAMEHMKDDFVYINGDVVFYKEVLERLLKSHYDTCIAVEKKQVSEEEVKVRLVSNLVKAIGKDLKLSKAHGEFIGIARFSKRFNHLLIENLNKVVKEGGIDEFFEVALDRALKHYRVYAVDISDLLCVEVDNLEDFNKAKRIYLEITGENVRAKSEGNG